MRYIQCNKHPVWGLIPTKIVMLWGWFIVFFFARKMITKQWISEFPQKKSEKTISFHVRHPAFGQHLAFISLRKHGRGHSWSKDISIPEAKGCKCPGNMGVEHDLFDGRCGWLQETTADEHHQGLSSAKSVRPTTVAPSSWSKQVPTWLVVSWCKIFLLLWYPKTD